VTTEVGSPDIAATSSTRRFYVYSAVVAIAATIAVFGKVILYMVDHWRAVPDYSHGFVVAPLALYFAWERRRQLARAPIAPSWWGVLPLALGGLAYAIGRLGVELMSMRVGFVLTLMGMVLLLLGRPVFRILLFPLCFLFLMVPLPGSLLNVIAFPLQLVAADLAVTTLQLFGMPVLREGNIIHLPETQLFVAEACSGLRSLMALGTLGVVFAYFFRKTWGERLVLVASTLPIAVIVNAFRVMLTAFLTHRFGEGMADGVIHQTEGFFTFAVAFGLLLLEARLLAWLWPRARTPRASEVTA
jgi:exosortase